MFVKGLISFENGTVRVLARGLVITTILAIFGQLFMYELGSGISLLLIPLSAACFEITELILAKCSSQTHQHR